MQTGTYIWPESRQPLWRAKVLPIRQESSRKRNSGSGRPLWNRGDDARQNPSLPSSVFMLVVNMPQHYRKSQTMPLEITNVAELPHICLKNCFPLRGYYHCESGDKNHGDQRLTIDSKWYWYRRNKVSMSSITNHSVFLWRGQKGYNVTHVWGDMHFLTVMSYVSNTDTP